MCVNGKAAGWKCRDDRSLLCRQSELLSFQHFGDVEIEKVAIKDGLDTAGEDRDQVEKSLEVVSEKEGGKNQCDNIHIVILIYILLALYVKANIRHKNLMKSTGKSDECT